MTKTNTNTVEIPTPSEDQLSTPTRSSSISFDERSINDESESVSGPTEPFVVIPTPSELSSSLSELDPMFQNPSPSPSLDSASIQIEPPLQLETAEQPVTVEIEQPVTVEIKQPETVEIEQPVTVEIEQPETVEIEQPKTVEIEQPKTVEIEQPPVIEESDQLEESESTETPSETLTKENIFQIVSEQDDAIDIPYEKRFQKISNTLLFVLDLMQIFNYN